MLIIIAKRLLREWRDEIFFLWKQKEWREWREEIFFPWKQKDDHHDGTGRASELGGYHEAQEDTNLLGSHAVPRCVLALSYLR